MKVSIVTVYDSINCGSYWQAYVLGQVLKRLGCEVVYNDRKKNGGASSSWKKKFKTLVRLGIEKGPSAGILYFKSIRMFNKMKKSFIISKNIEDVDCFVLGSDTIWNLDSAYFKLHASTYWGIDFLPKKVVSYAVSAANTEGTKVTDELHTAVSQMFAVSVRDQHTYDLIKDDADKSIEIVCDPTLLLTKEEYKQFIEKEVQSGFVYLYLFKDLSPKQAENLKLFCNKQNLRIVEGVSFNKPSYCDEASLVEPRTFLSYMNSANYVITDTFHGTVFSAIFKKQFISLNRGKNKVKEFLTSVGLESRLIEEDKDFILELTQKIDYDTAGQKMEELRYDSLHFLQKNVVGEKS